MEGGSDPGQHQWRQGSESWHGENRGHRDYRGRGGGGRGRGGRHRPRSDRDRGIQDFGGRSSSRGNFRQRNEHPPQGGWQHAESRFSESPAASSASINSNNNPVPLTELQIDPPLNENLPRRHAQEDRYFDGGRSRGPRRGGGGWSHQPRGAGRHNNWRTDSASRSALNPDAAPFEPKPNSDSSEGPSQQQQMYPQQQRKNEGRRDVRHRTERTSKRSEAQENSGNLKDGAAETSESREREHFKSEFDGRNQSVPREKGKPKNQREVLMDQLSRSAYECMVCCEKVRHSHPIWSCKRCFNVFHLHCIRKWASSSVDETGWRCPGCQSCYESNPEGYYCFCGKTKNPKAPRHDIPHTCGQTCGKSNPGGLNCTHNCISTCHPGPCPSCEVQLVRYCGCGKTNAQVMCGSKAVICCGGKCSKKVACGVHVCSRTCHFGDCDPCEEKVVHECHCGSESKTVACTSSANQCKSYSCLKPCKKPLSCRLHQCQAPCHIGSCGPCKTSPEAVISCPCGQTPIDEACAIARLPKRTKCTERIPTCGKICLRILPCGDEGNKHKCQRKCHEEEECPVCQLISNVICRCGGKTMAIPCKELRALAEITCQKKCTKKRSCGKHKCNSTCCIDLEHICPIVCNRRLRCGLHVCSQLCHLNPCAPCDIVSFDELTCECGASVIYPPVPCGTRRPPCQAPCSRTHECDHPVLHPCHSESTCPPCTVLTEKWCHGKHELRKNIMCHINEISCGLSCGKQLLCGRHKCPLTCHAGPCIKDGEVCKLPCTKPRSCGHPCGAPCHEDECPQSKCKIMTEVVCKCRRRVETLICWRREIEWDREVTYEYHKELKRLEETAKANQEEFQTSDTLKEKVMSDMKTKIPKAAVLDCDKECARLERNRKMAEALQLENPDVTTSVGNPNYSEYLTKFAKKNPQFIEMVHKNLTDLVMKAKQSRKKNETYGFNSMNRDKRHVIHEYSDHFGVLSESFDEEPNRNVVCFASKEKSYLPSVGLIDFVFRPAVRSERRRPNDDVSFTPDKRAQIVGPSPWNMKPLQKSLNEPKMVTLTSTSSSGVASDFPPL